MEGERGKGGAFVSDLREGWNGVGVVCLRNGDGRWRRRVGRVYEYMYCTGCMYNLDLDSVFEYRYVDVVKWRSPDDDDDDDDEIELLA